MFSKLIAILSILMFCIFSFNRPANVSIYITEYEILYKLDTSKVDIYFLDNLEFAKKNAIGFCIPHSFRRPSVLFSKQFWDHSSFLQKRLLVFHELTHCIQNRPHRNEVYINDGCPKSIMNWQIFSDACYYKHESDLLQELKPN